jgi:tetratricopeptide (TPR) repeat protein
MATLEHLDLLLGEALECMEEAAHEARGLALLEPDNGQILRYIGNALGQLWGIRDEILYRLKPELKRDFVKEIEQDKTRWEELNEIHEKAYLAESKGEIHEAMSLFNKLLTASRFGYFRLLAQAGLYRVSKVHESKNN